MPSIRYRKGLKYQLVEEYVHLLPFAPERDIITPFVNLLSDGRLIITTGYAWDGPSGPAIDDSTNLRGSLVHDAGYQLMRLGLLPQSFRDRFDQELRRICLQDGMWPLRAEIYFEGVHLFGEQYAQRQSEPVYSAP